MIVAVLVAGTVTVVLAAFILVMLVAVGCKCWKSKKNGRLHHGESIQRLLDHGVSTIRVCVCVN